MYESQIKFSPIRHAKGDYGIFETLWFEKHPFDFNYPFRYAIKLIHNSIEQEYGNIQLEIQPFEIDEDFIEFTFIVDQEIIYGYFEYSVCYLQLSSTNDKILRFMRKISNKISFSSNGNNS